MTATQDAGHAPANKYYRPDIDGLRGIGMLAVLVAHAFPSRLPGGFVAVDMFFTVSGFLITGIILRGLAQDTFTFSGFYAARIRRIFPALLVVLVATFVTALLVLSPQENGFLGKHVAAGAGFAANIALAGESGYFKQLSQGNPLLHLWSLGVEEQFYIVWPFLMFALRKRIHLLVPALITIIVVSFAINIVQVHTNPVVAYYSPLTRLWQIAGGALLAYVMHFRPSAIPKLPNFLTVIGLGISVVTTITFNESMAWPGFWAVLPIGGTLLVVAAGSSGWVNRHVLSNPIAVGLGVISYPVYVWHWPLLSLGLDTVMPEPVPGLGPRTIKIITMAISVVLGWLTYQFFERPIRSGRWRGPATGILATAMIVMCALGIAQYTSGGFALRVPPAAASLMAHRFEGYEAYYSGECVVDNPGSGDAASICTTGPTNAKTSIVSWGDSHTAHLHPGLEATRDSSTRLTQFTMGACPPFRDYAAAGPVCQRMNNAALEFIAAKKPDRVMLAASWVSYDWSPIERTISELRALGIRQVDVIGPVPTWGRKLLRAQMYRVMRDNKLDSLPARLMLPRGNRTRAVDSAMRVMAARNSVRYFSPYSLLCSDEGCLTMLGSEPSTLTTWDQSHLTRAASVYLVSRFAP